MMAKATTTVDGGAEASQDTILRRIAIYAPSSLLPAALTLVTSLVFTRLFSAAAFGVYSLFLTVAVPIKLVCTTWIMQGVGKFLPVERTEEGRQRTKDAIFVSGVIVFMCESILGLAALSVSGMFLSSGQRPYLAPMIAFVVVSSTFELLAVVLAAEHRAKEYTRYKLTDSVMTFALRLLMVSALLRMDPTLMFWSVVLSNGVLVPLVWRRAGLPRPRRLRKFVRSAPIRERVRAFLLFGLPMTIWFFSGALLDVGDRFVISYFLGPAPVGIYDASYRLVAGSAVLLIAPVTITLHPYLMSVAGTGESKRISQVLGIMVENLFLIGVLAVGLTYLFCRDAGNVLLGPEFREGSAIMPLVLAGICANNIGTFVHKPFEITGRTRPMVVLGLVSMVANIGLNFVLVPWVGYLGAAYATLVSYLLYAVGVGAWGRRIYPWRIDLAWSASFTLIVVLGVVAIRVLRGTLLNGVPYWWNLAVAVVASMLLAGWCLLRLIRRTSAFRLRATVSETGEAG
jgi:O-antigen/teichoic acid export membrane protein